MWHKLETVAFHRILDPVKFANYANEFHADKVVDDEVNSLDVDQVVREYREFIGAEEADRDRKSIIAASMGKL